MDMGWFVGYLDEYPEYKTQAETLVDLEFRLRTLYTSVLKANLEQSRYHGQLKLA